MPTPLTLTPADIKDGNGSVYIEYEMKVLDNDNMTGDASTAADEVEPMDTITNVLMNRCNHYVSPKPSANAKDSQQFNALVNLTKERKFDVVSYFC